MGSQPENEHAVRNGAEAASAFWSDISQTPKKDMCRGQLNIRPRRVFGRGKRVERFTDESTEKKPQRTCRGDMRLLTRGSAVGLH